MKLGWKNLESKFDTQKPLFQTNISKNVTKGFGITKWHQIFILETIWKELLSFAIFEQLFLEKGATSDFHFFNKLFQFCAVSFLY